MQSHVGAAQCMQHVAMVFPAVTKHCEEAQVANTCTGFAMSVVLCCVG